MKYSIIALATALSILPAYAQDEGPVTVSVGTSNTSPQGRPASTVGASGNLDLTGNVRRPRNSNEDFLSAASTEFPDTALARPTADLDRTIIQGSVISATMETRLISDLPGTLRAIVNLDVRSYDGSKVLVPKGSRLIGTYRSDLKINQSRALILWSRIITPDGLSIMVGSPGVDRLGSAGQTGLVNKHFRVRFGSAALISLIGAAPTVAAASSAENDATSELISNIGSDFQEASSSVVSDYLNIQPTILIHQGTTLNVMVNRDIIFPYVD